MVSGPFGGAVHNRRRRRNREAQRDLDVYVHRADAERGKPHVRRFLKLLS